MAHAKCAYLLTPARRLAGGDGRMTGIGNSRHRTTAMRTYRIDLPSLAADALEDAARLAGIGPDEVIVDALRTLPLFQRALQERPESTLGALLLSGSHSHA
ncbi:hypothetical protein XcfCFBP6990P_13060 [Xanthomonas citri pv. phaseoli var. fuscans]|nr:hypothetical protein XcfCFBP6988P_16190 [Xanthomonas citri pv. phaseoli var. fuscans]ATS41719.1 hypothetical protein XcfCFBP6989P_04305 [Xanthomonas citri pv. phaseoli var. fuscans]ATS47477.1 hypothetical protein XcfCFBP6990P_13060 [Xanthomonas citri pv. phaseoli var. fuscans]ATS86144.1 hypothetical protein XcfCFBP6991P_21175 [Xanthomonas citri pv. phaseoli var. fuscans]QWN21110.1 hypothetical protein DGM98_14110 [Xanthomonas citri]